MRDSHRRHLQGICVAIVGTLLQGRLLAEDPNARYAYRVPDWLWTQQRFTATIPAGTRRDIEQEIEVLEALADVSEGTEFDERESKVARTIAGKLALRDLTAGAPTLRNEDDGTRLAVQLDPAFSEAARDTLVDAVDLFLTVALDPELVQRAIDTSVDTPSPMPDTYEVENGAPRKDEFGNKIFTEDYAFYLEQIPRPSSASTFRRELRRALSTPTGMPALLVVSQYSGGDWWGGAYYGFFNDDVQLLRRVSPARGYLYIRVNSDKFEPGQTRSGDPAFWASKIAHEVLHNLGYWHPDYKDPRNRDENNKAGSKAFIVAYENEVLEALDKERRSRATPGR